jgi:hypothetical protein
MRRNRGNLKSNDFNDSAKKKVVKFDQLTPKEDLAVGRVDTFSTKFQGMTENKE